MLQPVFHAALDASLLTTLSSLFLLGFAGLSLVDGVWIHLIRLRLYAHPASRAEHLLHTARALLFPVILLAVFAAPDTATLWLGLAAVAVDQAVELGDTAIERRSRAALGGLSSGEYSLHVTLTTLRSAALAFAIASVAVDAPGATTALRVELAHLLSPGAVLVGLLHVLLALPAAARAPLAGCCAAPRGDGATGSGRPS